MTAHLSVVTTLQPRDNGGRFEPTTRPEAAVDLTTPAADLTAWPGATFNAEMFTPEGNAAVRDALATMGTSIRSRGFTEPTLHDQIVTVFADIGREHPELHDTEPESIIVETLNPVLIENGYNPIDRSLFW